MKTSYLLKSLLLIFVLAVASPSMASDPKVTSIENPEAYANQLKNRLEEIKAIDTKSLTRQEKKALRAEVKTIKKELAAVGGGVYLSIGAIILIVLLIILLA
jgi:hypothetical protein